MKDRLESEFEVYKKSMLIWELMWSDTEQMVIDVRGKEIARQLTRAVGSIAANIEEGYGRGFNKEYAHFLRISRGSARESKGWYKRSKFLLDVKIIEERVKCLDEIIAMLTATINTLTIKAKV
jgi:four helix bundle protein